MSENARYRHHAAYGDQCAHCVEEEIREDMESALAEARDKALEEAIDAVCRKADEVASIYHRDNDDLSGLGSAREVLEALRAAKKEK